MKCSFIKRAKGHFRDYTTGIGTLCSDCGQRVFNPDFAGDCEMAADIRKRNKRRKRAAQKRLG